MAQQNLRSVISAMVCVHKMCGIGRTAWGWGICREGRLSTHRLEASCTSPVCFGRCVWFSAIARAWPVIARACQALREQAPLVPRFGPWLRRHIASMVIFGFQGLLEYGQNTSTNGGATPRCLDTRRSRTNRLLWANMSIPCICCASIATDIAEIGFVSCRSMRVAPKSWRLGWRPCEGESSTGMSGEADVR